MKWLGFLRGGVAGSLIISSGCATVSARPTSPPSTESIAASKPLAPTGELVASKTKPLDPAAKVEATSSPLPQTPPPVPPKIVVIESRTSPEIEQASKLALQGNTEQSERELKSLVDRNPSLDVGWVNLGVLRERRGDLLNAEKAYLKALEVNPEEATALDFLCRLYARTGRLNDADALIKARLSKNPDSNATQLSHAYVLMLQSQYESAANACKKLLKADERNSRAMKLLAQIYFKEGKIELAKMVLENAKAIAPRDASIQNALGLVHLALKSKPAAMTAFRDASALNPQLAEAQNNYGALLNEAQDYESAVKVLEEAVQAAPDFASARLNLGNAYRGKQDFGKALEQYTQVLHLKPGLTDTYYNLAILYLDSDAPNVDTVERFKTAIAYFRQYQEKGGQDDRIEQYVKDANKNIEKESRKRERAQKEKLKKMEKADKVDNVSSTKSAVKGVDAPSVKSVDSQKAVKEYSVPEKLPGKTKER